MGIGSMEAAGKVRVLQWGNPVTPEIEIMLLFLVPLTPS